MSNNPLKPRETSRRWTTPLTWTLLSIWRTMLEVPILFFNHQLNTFVKMNLVWIFFNQLLTTFVKMNCNSVGEGVELEELPQNLIELRSSD